MMEEVSLINTEQETPEQKRWTVFFEHCDKSIETARKIFKYTNGVMEKEIPPGKFILYINATLKGTDIVSQNAKKLNENILNKISEAETGKETFAGEDNFLADNMRYCAGFKENDDRFVAVSAFNKEELLQIDFSKCLGIIVGGSRGYVTDEKRKEYIDMMNNVEEVMKKQKKPGTPVLSICWGAQFNAKQEGDKVVWNKTQTGRRVNIFGVQKSIPTEDGKKIYNFPDELQIPANRKQRVKLTENTKGIVLARNLNGTPEIIFYPETQTTSILDHIEVGPDRLAIVIDPSLAYKHDIYKAREVVFPKFLEQAGAYARGEIAA